MLVLSRQRDESIMIGDDVEVTILDVRGDKVRLEITAPKNIPIHRREIYDAIQREKAQKTAENDIPKKGRELHFYCFGIYGSDIKGQNSYVRDSGSGKRLECPSLGAEGYCHLGNANGPFKRCSFGLEKFLE